MHLNIKDVRFFYMLGIIVLFTGFIPFFIEKCIFEPISPFVDNFPRSLDISSEIVIDSNNDFATLGCPGNGTVSHPYLLENRFVNVSGNYVIGIHVMSTSAFFVIQNCTVFSTYVGIFCEDIQDGTATIRNNTCQSTSKNGGGIILYTTENHQIVNNTCCDFMQGIHLNLVSNCLIENNTILRNNYQGINIRYSSSIRIINNTIQDTKQFGVAIVGETSSYNSIYHNYLSNNSIEAEYEIDGERYGNITSQGYDEGYQNVWYNESLEQGNWWSDYSGNGSYSIDGPSEAVDRFPLCEVPNDTSITILGYPFFFLILGFCLIITKIIFSSRLIIVDCTLSRRTLYE